MFLTIVKMAVRVGIIMRMPEQQLRIVKPVPTPNKGPTIDGPRVCWQVGTCGREIRIKGSILASDTHRKNQMEKGSRKLGVWRQQKSAENFHVDEPDSFRLRAKVNGRCELDGGVASGFRASSGRRMEAVRAGSNTKLTVDMKDIISRSTGLAPTGCCHLARKLRISFEKL